MNSSISASEPRRWRRCLGRYVTSCVIIGGLVAAVLIGTDPYDTGRFAVSGGYGVPASLGPRLSVASVGRDPDAEAAIVGNSTIQLLDPARLSETTGSKFVTLAIAGTGPLEQLAVTRWFLRHHDRPKALVFGLDRSWCADDGQIALPNPFPFWLYSSNPFAYAVNMLQLKTFESVERKLKLVLGMAPALRADGYRDYESERQWDAAAAERDFLAAEGAAPVSDSPDFAAVPLMQTLLTQLPAAAQAVIVFPPRHYSSLPPPGSASERVEAQCKAAFRGLAQLRQKTFVIDLAVDGDIARDDRAFWDKVHYRGPVARVIEADIAGVLKNQVSDADRLAGER